MTVVCSKRSVGLGLLALALAGAALVFVSPAGAVSGTGDHSGVTVQPTTKANAQPPCTQADIDYTGTGSALLSQGRVTYSGGMTVRFFLDDAWAAPQGTIIPKSDDPATACGDGTADNPPEYGPVSVTTASIEGSTLDNFSIKCQWDASSGGTFNRRATAEQLILPAGSAAPVDGAPGTCTIRPPVGQPRVSNTRIESTGVLGPCAGFPPVSCQHSFTLTATTEGSVADGTLPKEPPPVVSSVEARALPQGSGLQAVKITGAEFDRGSRASFSGPGITVSKTDFESLSRLGAEISVASDAPVGRRDVTITASDGTSGTCIQCFEVLPGTAGSAPDSGPGPGSAAAAPGPQLPAGSGTSPGGSAPGTGTSGGALSQSPGPGNAGGQPTLPAVSGPGPTVPAGSNLAGPPGTGGGTGSAPAASQLHAPAALLGASEEEAEQSAPEGGTRVMMVGSSLEGLEKFLATLLILAGAAFFGGCFLAPGKVPWAGHRGYPGAAPAFARPVI